MYFYISLIPRGTYFLLPLESKQEASSGCNVTKCISELKVNQLKVKNIHVKMGISTIKGSILTFYLLLKYTRHFSTPEHLKLIKGSKLFLPFENSLLFHSSNSFTTLISSLVNFIGTLLKS